MARSRRKVSSASQVLVLAALVLTLYFARPVLMPLALALLISFLLTPLVTKLERLRIGRLPAVLLAVLLSVAAAASIGAIVGYQLLDIVTELPRYRLNIHNKIAAIHAPSKGPLAKAMDSLKQIDAELTAPDSNAPQKRAATGKPTPVEVVEKQPNSLENARNLLLPALKPLITAVIVLAFTIFLLVKREDLRNRILRLAGLSQLNLMTQALDDGVQRLSRYLLMQFLVNCGYGILFGLGLFLIGVPNAPLWGAILALFRMVPYVGAVAAVSLPTLQAFAVFNNWWPVLLVVALFACLEIVVANFIEPWLYGAHTGISALALLFSMAFWSMLWGWTGLILSTPLTVCLMLLGRYVPNWNFLHILLGDEVPLSTEAQFCQRLLAMDQVEAREIVDRYLKVHSLVELYDCVILPALSLAEQDRHKGALDENREAFLFLYTNELLAELSDYKYDSDQRPRTDTTGRVFCVPANDPADEIAASMLTQLAERSGRTVISFAVNTQWDELLRSLEPGSSDVVFISSLPPFAFAHARAAYLRARRLAKDAKIMVGIWGFSGDTVKLRDRFGHAQPDEVFTSLAQAVEWLTSTGDRRATPEPSASSRI